MDGRTGTISSVTKLKTTPTAGIFDKTQFELNQGSILKLNLELEKPDDQPIKVLDD